jgi:hypothetical protein
MAADFTMKISATVEGVYLQETPYTRSLKNKAGNPMFGGVVLPLYVDKSDTEKASEEILSDLKSNGFSCISHIVKGGKVNATSRQANEKWNIHLDCNVDPANSTSKLLMKVISSKLDENLMGAATTGFLIERK